MFNKFSVLRSWQVSAAVLVVTFFGCAERNSPQALIKELRAAVNPGKLAPLGARLTLTTEKPTRVRIRVLGQRPVEEEFETMSDQHDLPVLGLYAGTTNHVEVTATTARGNFDIDTVEIVTDPLPDIFPEIRVDTAIVEAMEPGMHLINLNLANFGKFRTFPVLYDNQGKVRWMFDLSFVGDLTWGIQRLPSGNIGFAGANVIYEYNMLGEEINRVVFNGYSVHHDFIVLPDGNYLLAVSKWDELMPFQGDTIKATQDHIALIEANTGQVLRDWDLKEVMDVDRDAQIRVTGDWLHANSIWFDAGDSSIIISSRSQGVLKVNWENELQWIMSPHRGWEQSGTWGDGFDTAPFLMTAVDDNGAALEPGVQEGITPSDQFDWGWGQHSAQIVPGGNLFLFDNGTRRHFDYEVIYSQAAEYEFDEANRTIKKVWSYGKEDGESFYSDFVSNVRYLPLTANRLINSGAIRTMTPARARIIEVQYPSGKRVFDSTLLFKDANGEGASWGQIDLVYRAGRMTLYP